MEVYKDTGTANLTTTSATFATIKTLTADRSGEAGAKDFLVGGFSGVSTNNSSSLFGYRMTVAGVEIGKVGDTTNDELDIIGSSRHWPMSTIKKVSITNASVDIDMDVKTDLGTLTAVGHSLFAVEFGSDWEYAESEGESTTDSTSFQDKTTLTFTPGSTQDYYIIATMEIMQEDETSPSECRIIVDGSEEELWNPLGLQSSGNDNRYVQVGFYFKKNLDTTSHTIKIQHRATTTGGADTAFIRNARVVAIPATGEFIQNAYDQTDDTKETTDTATFPSWTDIETLVQTVNAGDHLCFGYMKFGGIVNTEEVAAQVDFAGVDFMGGRLKDADTDASPERWHNICLGAVLDLTSGSKSFKLQGAETDTTTEEFDRKHLMVLELEAGGTAFTKELTEVVVLADTLTRQTQLLFTEVITLVDTIVNQTQKTFTEVITLVDTLARQINKTLNETITLTDVFASVGTFFKSLAETVTLTDTVANKPGKQLTETITLTDTITRQTQKVLGETLTLIDTITRQVQKVLADTITLVDTVTTQSTLFRTLTETITLVDTIVTQIARTLTERITLVDTIVKQTERSFTEAIALTDTFIKNFQRTLTESITVVDSIQIVKSFFRTLTENITLTDNITALSSKVFSEVITLTDTVGRQISRLLSEAITLGDNISNQITIALTEVITLTDTLATVIKGVFAKGRTVLLTTLEKSVTVLKKIQNTVLSTSSQDTNVVKLSNKDRHTLPTKDDKHIL